MSALPCLGAAIPRRGSRALVALGRSMLRVMRWRVEGDFPDRPKLVLAVAPHTSNWDFLVGVAVMFALDLRVDFIGKHTLFVGPFGTVLRWMGGIPVDRSKAHGVVEQSVAAFAAAPQRVLAIAPQGTRRPVPRFKSGFLHIARGAGVPVVLVAFDWRSRCVRIGPTLAAGDDVEADRVRIEAHFAGVRGRNR